MYYSFLPYPRTHMPAAESSAQLASYELRGLDAYELRGLGTAPPVDSGPTGAFGGTWGAFGLVAVTAALATPGFVGYGVHKRGHGLGMSALAAVGAMVLTVPALFIVPFGGFVIPFAAAYYAFKD